MAAQDPQGRFFEACQVGDVDFVLGFIAQPKNQDSAVINAATAEGGTGLYIAARAGQASVVNALLALPALNPNLPDGHLQTALHRSCELGHDAVTRVLLSDSRVQPDATDLIGRTPLHWACAKGNLNIAKELLEKKAKLLPTKGGETPLYWAARSGSVDLMAILLKYDPELKIYGRNERGESVLDVAATAEARQYLLAHAASVGEVESSGKIRNEEFGTSVKIQTSLAPKKAEPKKIAVKLLPKGK